MTWRVTVLILALTGAALVAIGCGGGSGIGPGSGIIGPLGGRLEAGGIIVDVPPGALPAEFTLLVTPLSAAQVPAPPGGLAVMPAAQFDPDGLLFALPVAITFPVSARLPAGQTLPLYWLQGSVWQDSGFDAVVSADGRTAETQVSHFSVYAIFADYAPFSVGASWTYHRVVQTTPAGGAPNPPDASTVIATITGTDEIGGLTAFVWSESDPSNVTLYLHRSDSELLLVALEQSGEPREVLDPPARLLMLPPAAGQTWQVTPLLDDPATATVSAETVTVGGVEYDAMKVHIEPETTQGYMDLWFAPEVGPVKWKQAVVEPGVQTTVIEMDLQSYSFP